MAYSEAFKQSVVDDFYNNPNRSLSEIAESFSISITSVSKWITKHNEAQKMKYSAELKQAAIDDFYRDPNRSTQEIADSFGISRTTFDIWLNAYQKEKHTPK